MLKDYCAGSSHAEAEETFVGAYWDEKWRASLVGLEERKERVRHNLCLERIRSLLGNKVAADILDCGTGLGEWTLVLSEMGHRSIGIDIAQEQIGRLQREFGETLFQQRSFLETGFADNSFDVVFNWGGAEHFEQGIELGLREAYRLLRPRGFVLISTPAHNFRHMLRGFGEPPAAHCAASRRFYQYRYTRAEVIAELRAAGFEVVSSEFFSKWQGAYRFLHEEGKILARIGTTRIMTELLRRVLPGWMIGHMILAIGRRPGGVETV